MPAPLQTSGAKPESQTWQELEDVFAVLGQFARSPVAPPEFYRTVLDQSLRALAAVGGTVWLRASGGVLQPIAQSGWANAEFVQGDEARRSHEALLLESATQRRVVCIASDRAHGADSNSQSKAKANGRDVALLVGPVQVRVNDEQTTTAAIVELWLRDDASPATYRGCEHFLTAVCELAADYHSFNELRRLQQGDNFRGQLLHLGRRAHSNLKLSEAAYAVANEGRRVIGCDRLNVLVARGRGCRLLAASGASRIERRSGAARRLEKLAEMVRRTDEPGIYADGQCDALPAVADALELHAEESHARRVAAIPVRRCVDVSDVDADNVDNSQRRRNERPLFVLVAEQFDAREDEVSTLTARVAEVSDVCGTALYNALDYDRMPLGWLLRPVGAATRKITEHMPRSLVIVAAIVAAVTALVKVPADFHVEATGAIQPVARRDVFAPRSGLVDEVLVTHGADVAIGEPLVRMRDPSLELELKRVDGELATAQRQIDAVRATRTSRSVRDAAPVESYRLSAEERELEQRLANLRRELELLNHERAELLIKSPISGRVLTWDVAQRLTARPVERGEVLVSVADMSAPWQLELAVPDDQIGYVLAARQELEANLPVRYRLSSDDREQHDGKIAEICQTADVKEATGDEPKPTVLVKVAIDTPELAKALGGELRPGVSARAQIACGRRPIGYVWLHDLWDAAVEWVTF